MRTRSWMIGLGAALALVGGGLPADASAKAPRAKASIVAGRAVAITEAPYQVRVLVSSGGYRYQCGGSIVDATHVVTAAHCVYINGVLADPASVSVGYGSASTRTLRAAVVAEVTMPQAYATDASYDVARLTLRDPLTYSGSVQPIAVADQSAIDSGTSAESSVFVTGWGATSQGGSGTTSLRGVQIPLRADAVCSAYYASYVSRRTVCAGGNGFASQDNPDSCQGDSGGPLVLGGALAGIVSYGDGCGKPGVPGAYTEPSADGIRQVIDGSAPASSLAKGGATATSPSPAPSPAPAAPAVTTPVSQTLPAPLPVVYDRIRPTASITKIACARRGRCTVRIRAADRNGAVVRLSAVASRSIRICSRVGARRRCRTDVRRTTLRVRRARGEFVATGTLAKATYTLTVVAVDRAGNRSTRASKRFRVRS